MKCKGWLQLKRIRQTENRGLWNKRRDRTHWPEDCGGKEDPVGHHRGLEKRLAEICLSPFATSFNDKFNRRAFRNVGST